MKCIPLRNDPICGACYESDEAAVLSGKDDATLTRQARQARQEKGEV